MRDADIPLIPSLCSAIITACDEAKAVQAQFLAERGLTLEQARDLSEKEKTDLQSDYTAWLIARENQESPTSAVSP